MATSIDEREEIKPVAPTEQTKWRDPSLVGKYMVDPKTGLAGLFRSPDNGETWVLTDTVYGHVYNQDEVDNIWDNGAAHKVADEIKSATADLPNVRKQANEAVKFAESAIAASKVNSDAIVAQSSAVIEAKSAMDSATAEVQQLKANAASDVAQIRADVAQVQNEVDTAKAANSASVDKLKSDIGLAQKDLDNVRESLTKAQSAVEQNQKLINDSVAKINSDIAQNRQDIVTAQQANDDLAKQLDTYSKEAQEQGKTIKTIQDNQDGFSITIADVKGDVTKVSDTVDGLSAGLKDAQGNIASVKAQANQLNATLTDHSKNIAQLTATAKELSSTLEDADGRLSKVEQTASEQSTTLSDLQGNLTQVKQTADGLVTTLKDAQGNIDQIKQDAKGTLEQLSNVQGDIAALQKDVSGIKLTIANHDKNIHTLQADSKTLKDDMADAKGNISSLQKTSTSLVSEFKDHDGRLSKVEQTATEHTSELADTKGNLDKVTQKANTLQLLLSDAQKNIQNIHLDAKGLHDTLTGQGNQLASLNVTLNNLDSKYSGITGDLQSKQTALSTEQQQTKDMLLNKADKSEVDNVKGTVSKVSAEQKVMADQISSKVSSADYQKDKTDTINAIEKNSTAIDETNKLVSIKADKTEVNNLNNTAQQLSARLNVMAGQVQSKVDETKVNNLIDGRGFATQSTVQSLIDQRAGTLSESITGLETKFSNSSSINLAEKTNQGVTNWQCDPGNGATNLTEININGARGVRFNNTKKSTSWWVAKYPLNLDFFEPNTDYIVTFDIRTSTTVNSQPFLQIAQGDSSHQYFADADTGKSNFPANQLVHVSIVKHTNDTLDRNAETFYLNSLDLGNCDWVDIVNFKIARGTIDKGYSAAPSDNATVTQLQSVTASIDGLQSNVTNFQNNTNSQFTQLSNVMQSKVGSADFNALKQRVDMQTLDSADINNMKTSGHYFVHNLANSPISGWVYVDVTGNGNDRIRQDVYQDNGIQHKYRRWVDTHWTGWEEGATYTEITQLQDAINLRVQKGELLSQINLTAGNTLIQTGKLYLDSSSVVFSGRAFIPSAAIAELDADKLTFYGNGSKASIGAGIAQYDQDKIKSTINLQYQGGFEIHSSNQLGSILTMHDNTVRLAVKSNGMANPNSPTDQYSGFYASTGYSLMNSYLKDGTTSGISIGSTDSGVNKDYRIYVYDGSNASNNLSKGISISTSSRFDVYAGNSQLFLGPDKAELRGNDHATVHGNDHTFIEGGNQQIYMHNGEVNIGNPNDTGNATGVHFQVFGWASFNGYVEGMGWTTKSTLSSKTRIEKLDTEDALNKIMSTDLETYQYETEVAGGMTKRHAGPIIDDVHDVAQYSTPDEFINERRTGRSDADVIGYLMGAVQELKKQLDKVKEKINYE